MYCFLITYKTVISLSVQLFSDRSTVMLAAKAFQDPFVFLYGVETSNDIREYETYFEGTSDYNSWFKVSALKEFLFKLELKVVEPLF